MSQTSALSDHCDVAIVGAGFAGSILARILNRQGYRVTLLERGRHPRFAIGESSTPLANLCLERLARRWDLSDLRDLATWGRWLETHPGVRRGLKRGFSFYRHTPGESFRNGRNNHRRLLVAASPDDRVADSHWLREDVDAFLVDRAVEEGVDYRDLCSIEELLETPDGWRLVGRCRGEHFDLGTGFVVDGSGAGGFLARALPIDSALDDVALATQLVFGHFTGVDSFVETASAGGASFEGAPYPEERAAIHHLLEEGWMYVLPFDHGVTSAGFLLTVDPSAAAGRDPEDPAESWSRLLGRYPSLATQFAGATPLVGPVMTGRVQRRLRRAQGRRWALLPHAFAFLDPMYSTGIAWSLLGVERLALLFEEARGASGGTETPRPSTDGLLRYERLLAKEADQMERLLMASYLARDRFELFSAIASLYFVSVSYSEVAQRLRDRSPDGGEWAWRGFLSVDDPLLGPLFGEARARVRDLAGSADVEDLVGWIRRTTAARDIAGLADPGRRNLHPVDFGILIERAELLGVTPEEMRENLPRLRGMV